MHWLVDELPLNLVQLGLSGQQLGKIWTQASFLMMMYIRPEMYFDWHHGSRTHLGVHTKSGARLSFLFSVLIHLL
jgi:hypothetical protein